MLLKVIVVMSAMVVSTTSGQQTCPRLRLGQVGICIEACRADSDCGTGEMCCSNGCGHQCVNLLRPPAQYCAPVLCRMACPHGWAIDRDECELCACHSPCATVTCPVGQQCIAVQPQCIRAPCMKIGQCQTPSNPAPATQVCYTAEPNYHRIGGMGYRSAMTNETCAAACTTDPTCMYYDWAPSGNPYCWLHRSAANVRAYSMGVTLYTKGSCSMSKNMCTWMSSPGMHGIGGTPRREVTSRAGCETVAMAAGCAAYDWVPSVTPSCWTYTSMPLTKSPMTGATFYYCDKGMNQAMCYIASPRSHLIGGTGEPTAMTNKTCAARCDATSGCVAYDWAPGVSTKCWLHSNPIAKQEPALGITVYRKQTCAQAARTCTYSWMEYAGQHGIGSTGAVDAADRMACQDLCKMNPQCVGYDWVTSAARGQQCWPHTSMPSRGIMSGASYWQMTKTCGV